jgi:hypothetical protein
MLEDVDGLMGLGILVDCRDVPKEHHAGEGGEAGDGMSEDGSEAAERTGEEPLDEPAGEAEQPKRGRREHQEQVLEHMGAEKVFIAQLIERGAQGEQGNQGTKVEGSLTPPIGPLAAGLPRPQRAQGGEVREGPQTEADDDARIPGPFEGRQCDHRRYRAPNRTSHTAHT